MLWYFILQVSTNGYITFGSPLIVSEPEFLPATDYDTFWSYMIAPFWADFDTTIGGTVSWELHDRSNSPDLVEAVDSLIADEYDDPNFEGSWMLVAFWENVQPSELDGVRFCHPSNCLLIISLVTALYRETHSKPF